MSWILVGVIVVSALLESVFAFGRGCEVLQAGGVIQASVCEACLDGRTGYGVGNLATIVSAAGTFR